MCFHPRHNFARGSIRDSHETPLYVPCKTPPEFKGETVPVTPCNVTRDTPSEQLSHRGAGSSANGYPLYGSRRSSSGKSSKVRFAVAQLKGEETQKGAKVKGDGV